MIKAIAKHDIYHFEASRNNILCNKILRLKKLVVSGCAVG